MILESEGLSLHHHDLDPTIDRERLVRFCRRLTGDRGQAEDLAQEALLRAWKYAKPLEHPERRDAWLKAIARNLYRRSLRDQRPSGLPWVLERGRDETGTYSIAEPADDYDLEVELDRQELASLLDRAMELLPTETREILVDRFIRESPLAETAQRLGLSEGAVAMRVQRGKVALRRVLVTAFPEGLETLGVDPGEGGRRWKATRIWCPWCGQRRLDGLLARDLGVFRLSCPTCGQLNNSRCVNLFATAPGHRSALLRLLEWTDDLYKYSFDHRTVPCDGCGRVLDLRKAPPHDESLIRASAADDHAPGVPRRDLSRDQPVISYFCPRCRGGTWNGQMWNLLGLPETRAFWREHPRMRRLPDREVEARGQAAVVTGFESIAGGAHLDIVYARDNLVVLGTHRTGGRS